MAFKNAKIAEINQGIITCFLSMYCVFTTIIFYFVFHEQLQQKFVVGITFMIACVVFVASPKESMVPHEDNQIRGHSPEYYCAISLGLIAPLFIAMFITVSKYWTTNYGYKS